MGRSRCSLTGRSPAGSLMATRVQGLGSRRIRDSPLIFNRMSDFVTIALAQFQPRKGDYAGNLARIAAMLAQAATVEPRPQLVCFPETALSGYFLEGGVRELAVTAGKLAADLHRAYGDGPSVDVCVGFYEVWRNKLYNSAMYVSLGETIPLVRHVHRKVFLPTYGLFDEERFVERGLEIRAFDTPWGRAALLVCEDVWHSMTGTIAALDGAQIIIVPTAPPARGAWPKEDGIPGPSSVSRWERLARDMADEHGIYVALVHLVGSEGGKQFPGAALLAGPKGDVRTRGPLWEEALVIAQVDLGDVTRARADMPLIADLETMVPHLGEAMMKVQTAAPHLLNFDGMEEIAASASEAPPAKRRKKNGGSAKAAEVRVIQEHTLSGPAPLEIDAALVEEWLVRFLRDEMQRRRFEKAVVGVSGGVDSAVTAYLAARALGAANVIGVRMPYRTSSPESLEHAQLMIDALGIESRTVDISAAVDGYLANEPDADGARRGNVMARMRMIALFDLSAKHRAIPLGTGNKTERLFGYFTWHADDSPPINPLGDLFKTQVWALARHLGVPEVIVGKAPSADLVVGQTDEGDFGISYPKADEILNWMLSGYSEADLVARGFDAAEVAVVRKRLSSTHWKRRLPTVAMLSSSAIGESYLRPVDY
ncbi:MAG: nadE [Gemmatimonadetes bacterium]|jgi:NAD+ synthase (glutamine-hydrolysing)|nr:nadE [Gemmatimonadota bacterium]